MTTDQSSPHYIAKRLEASSPDAKVLGAAFVAFFQHVRSQETQAVMAKLGLEAVEPDKWYPQQLFLDFYRIAEADPDILSENFVAIGMKFAETIPFPDDITTVKEALYVLNDMNETIHQNTPPQERWLVEDKDDNTIIVKYNMPYHEDAAYGYLWAIAKRFGSRDFRVTPIHDQVDDAPFAYEVSW